MKLWHYFNKYTLLKDSFIRSVSLLASGSILGQIVGFIGSIIMTHLFAKDSIGILTMLTSITGIFTATINGRFDYAIVKEQDDKKVINLIDLSLYTGFLFSIAISIGSIFYFYNKSEVINPYYCAIFVLSTLLLNVFTNVFRSYNNRVGDYKTMTLVLVIRKIAEAISMIIMGIINFGYYGLMISRIIGEYFGMKKETINIRRNKLTLFKSSKNSLLDVFRIHRKQLFYSTPAAIINTLSYSVISLFIVELYGFAELGMYSISFQVLGLPLAIISGNISKVYFSEASKEFAKYGKFRSITKKTTGVLLVLSIIVLAIMFWIIPYIVPFVYGNAYLQSGIFIKIFAPMFAIRFISSALITGLVVADKQQFEMILECGFIISAVAIYIATSLYHYDIIWFLTAFSIMYSIIYILFFIAVFHFSGGKIASCK